jgi:hypothetical protein
MPLPNYADYPGNLAYEQPFIMKQLQLYGFVIEGSVEDMQKMVDARLNFMSDRPKTGSIELEESNEDRTVFKLVFAM